LDQDLIDSYWRDSSQRRTSDWIKSIVTFIPHPLYFKSPSAMAKIRGMRTLEDNERLRAAVIRFGREYAPDRAAWERRLATRPQRTPQLAPSTPLAEIDAMSILAAVDELAESLSSLMLDDLVTWLISCGFSRETAEDAREIGRRHMPG